MGHKVTLVAGELDREGILIPELHFKSPTVAGIHHRVVYGNESYEKIERAIFDIAGTIEGRLRQLFRNGTKPDLLITPNVFSIPMHFPLAVALTRTIDEFEIKTIARHHDFWWERERYNKSHMFKFFEKWFPPKSDLIKHTVINSIARKSLKDHSGIEAEVIWDTFESNFPETILDRRSITDIPASDIPDAFGMIGGPPCQSWSEAGAGRGINDKRGQLFFEYIRLIKEKQPLFFLAENVSGILFPQHEC